MHANLVGRYEFHYDVSDSPSSYGGAPAAQFGAWEKRSGYSTQVTDTCFRWMEPRNNQP